MPSKDKGVKTPLALVKTRWTNAAAWIEAHEQILSKSYLFLVIPCFFGLYFTLASIHGISMDEGYYGWGAQYFADGDYLLTKATTDKPPLIYQILGVSLIFFGRSVMALKIPNAFALLILLLLTYAMGKRFFGAATGLLAAVLMVISPYMADMGVGAMTDPIAALLLIASLLAALKGRLFPSGFWLGLSICTRQMSLLFAPVSLFAGWMSIKSAREEGNIWPSLKRFVAGLALPVIYLLIWSNFFEKDRFRWLLQEISSGKVVMGKEQCANAIGRLWFWGSTIGSFFISPFFWWLALICLVIFTVLTFIDKKRDTAYRRISPANIKVLLFFSAIIFYYVISHTLIGIPLYKRMMFPLLPLLVLLFSFVLVRSAELIFPKHTYWKIVGLSLLTVLLIWGSAQNVKISSKLKPYDDLPEVAQLIRQMPQEKKMVISKDFNRQLRFLLYNTNIEFEQYQSKPILEIVDRFSEWNPILLITEDEREKVPQFARELSPRYELSQIATSSRATIQIFVIKDREHIR